jgi:phospholipid/cholesterol/gamma-HCH transport system substrate-binding protein
MAGADDDLRKVIDSGSFTSNQLRTFLEQNEAEVSDLLNNVITTGRVAVANIDGIRMLLIRYPDVVNGSFTVVAKNSTSGQYESHIGLILNNTTPCYQGYEGSETRGPQNVEPWDMNLDARCTEPPTKSNPRGVQNLPRVRPVLDGVTDVAPPPLGEDSWKWLYLEPLLDASS